MGPLAAFEAEFWLMTMDSTTFCRALNLAERVALQARGDASSAPRTTDPERAERRLGRWRSQPPFNTGDLFAERLLLEGIGESDLRCLLGESAESLEGRLPELPRWLSELKQALNFEDARPAFGSSGEAADHEGIGSLLTVFSPIIRSGRDRLLEGVRALIRESPNSPFDPETLEGLFLANLVDRLFDISCRTFVLELNVARVQGLLKGQTPEERFKSYLRLMRNRDSLRALLAEYPVMARRLHETVGNWTAFFLEFLENLSADWKDLQAALTPNSPPGLLIALEGAAGDSHRDGRSVLIAQFSSGFKAVYKPRSLAVDAHFQDLLAWTNARGNHPPFRILKILDRNSYGWVEYVEHRCCSSTEELRRFYRRHGGYLAVLYALEAIDFHSDNLIASGEHPVLIDLEALLHPQFECAGAVSPPDRGDETGWSVQRIGLLPFRVLGDASNAGVDLSGMGHPADQLSPMALPQWEDLGTDTMHLAKKRVAIPGRKNRPSLMGEEVNAADYSEEIVEGFTQLYQLLYEHRQEISSVNGLLDGFAKDEVRFIPRDTQTYVTLLQSSYHPDALRDALDRDRVLDFLWMEVENKPALARLIRAEHRDLSKGDIPLFTARPNSRDLWCSTGEQYPDFFETPSITIARRRLDLMCREDLETQLGIVRATLSEQGSGAKDGSIP